MDDVPVVLLPLLCFWYLIRGLILTAIGAVKGAILLLPTAFIIIPSWVCLTLYHFPRCFVATFYSFLVTRHIALDLKVLILLILPAPLILWPVVIAIAAVCFAVGLGFFYPLGCVVAVNDLTSPELLSMDVGKEVLETATKSVSDYHRFCKDTYYDALRELRAPYYGVPLSVSFTRLCASLLTALLTGVCSFVLIILIGIPKLPLATGRALVEYVKTLKECSLQLVCLWGPFWLVGLVLVPPVCLVAYLLLLIGCFAYIGPVSAFNCYTSSPPMLSGLRKGLSVMYDIVCEVDNAANEVIGCCRACCFKLPRRAGAHRDWRGLPGQRPHYNNMDYIAASYVETGATASDSFRWWKEFEARCKRTASTLVACGLIPRDDFDVAEGYLFIGIPGFAVLDMIVTASARNGSAGGAAPSGPVVVPAPHASAAGSGNASSEVVQLMLSTGIACGTGGHNVATTSADADLGDSTKPGANVSDSTKAESRVDIALSRAGSGATTTGQDIESGGEGKQLAAPHTAAMAAGTTAGHSAAIPSDDAGTGGASNRPSPEVCAIVPPDDEPGHVQHLIEVLSLEVLARDKGFYSSADPLSLVRSYKSLKASCDELLYMACHTAVVGGANMARLIQLQSASAGTQGAAGHAGPSHGDTTTTTPNPAFGSNASDIGAVREGASSGVVGSGAAAPAVTLPDLEQGLVDNAHEPDAAVVEQEAAAAGASHQAVAVDSGILLHGSGGNETSLGLGLGHEGALAVADDSSLPTAPLHVDISPERLAHLHAFTAAVQSVATALSKKMEFKRFAGDMLASSD